MSGGGSHPFNINVEIDGENVLGLSYSTKFQRMRLTYNDGNQSVHSQTPVALLEYLVTTATLGDANTGILDFFFAYRSQPQLGTPVATPTTITFSWSTFKNGISYCALTNSSTPPASINDEGVVNNGSTDSIEFEGLTGDTSYYFWITVYKGGNFSPWESLEVTTPFTMPVLTAAEGATVDAPFLVAYDVDYTAYDSAIENIQVGSNLLDPSSWAVSSSGITFTPANDVNLQTPGTLTITVFATDYPENSVSQPLGSGVAASVHIITQPGAPSINPGLLGIQPVIQVKDQYGNGTQAFVNATAHFKGGNVMSGSASILSASNGYVYYTNLGVSGGVSGGSTNYIVFNTGIHTVTSADFTITGI